MVGAARRPLPETSARDARRACRLRRRSGYNPIHRTAGTCDQEHQGSRGRATSTLVKFARTKSRLASGAELQGARCPRDHDAAGAVHRPFPRFLRWRGSLCRRTQQGPEKCPTQRSSAKGSRFARAPQLLRPLDSCGISLPQPLRCAPAAVGLAVQRCLRPSSSPSGRPQQCDYAASAHGLPGTLEKLVTPREAALADPPTLARR